MNTMHLHCFGLDQRLPTGFRLDLDRHAAVKNRARVTGLSVQRVLEHCVDCVFTLVFLDPPDRETVRAIAAELGAPFTPLDVVAGLVRRALAEIRQGKVVPSAWEFQRGFSKRGVPVCTAREK